jgi:hypothetical protein
MQKPTELYDISFGVFLQKLPSFGNYLLSKWRKFLLVIFAGALIGVLYSWIKPVQYTARISFVAEENKFNAGGLASLAGQFGLDLSAVSGGGTFFAGDNLLLFLKSEGLIREALLSDFNIGKSKKLADQFAFTHGYYSKWLKEKEIGEINFSKYSGLQLPRKEDSLLQCIITIIGKKLEVNKPDRKASFIEVKFSSSDEIFSKTFVERLVQAGVDRYIETKTKPTADNVAILQKRADSLVIILDNTTSAAATAQQPLVDLNPALRSAAVPAEIRARNKMMISTIYAEVIKNLELAKFVLQQDTPVIQIVDYCHLPLEDNQLGKIKAAILGAFISFLFFLVSLTFFCSWRFLLSHMPKV